MSSSDNELPSIAGQKKIINSELNLNLLTAYALGVYIGVYGVTILIYYNNTKLHRKTVIIGGLTALLAVILTENAIQWNSTVLEFVSQTASQRATFTNIVEGVFVTDGAVILWNVLSDVVFLIADGLMVWRCFYACGMRIRGHFILPLGLFIIEIGLVIADTVLRTMIELNPELLTAQHIVLFNSLDNAMICIVDVTSLTITSTVVICYHIYSNTTQNSRSRQRYKHLIDIMVQSSLGYTAVMILDTVVGFLDATPNQQLSLTILIVQNYTNFLVLISSGLAPTLMVARLAIASENKSTEETDCSVHLPSNLVVNKVLDHIDCGQPTRSRGSVVTIHNASSRIGENNV